MYVQFKYLDITENFIASKVFDAIFINVEGYELEKRLHEGLNGGYSESNVGWRRIITLELEPLLGDKEKLFYLYGFAIGNARQIITDPYGTPTTYNVTMLSDSLTFNHDIDLFFGNSISFELIETSTTSHADDGSTRKIIPTYSRSGLGISGNNFTVYCNLVDESSALIKKKQFRFLSGNPHDVAFGYLHSLTIDFGSIESVTERNWLRDFCLWGTKQIDTTTIDGTNGKVFGVVFPDEKIQFRNINNIQDAKGITLTFLEKTLRTVEEEYIEPAASPFILDSSVLDGTDVLG